MAADTDRIGVSSSLQGVGLVLLAAFSYTVSLVCMRWVAETHNPIWVSCVRAVPVTAVSWMLCSWRALQGNPVWPRGRVLVVLLVAAVGVQFGGNCALQWALGVIGLAMTVPLMYGAMIAGGALLGWLVLAESMSPRSWLAVILLMVAIGLISSGSGTLPTTFGELSLLRIALGVAAACLAGISYAGINVVIRRFVTRNVSVAATLLVIGSTGVVVLGLTSAATIGWQQMGNMDRESALAMFVAGVFNAIAFYAIASGLRLIPVVQANAINGSQTAMAAVTGALFFNEPLGGGLLLGIGLLIVALLLMRSGAAAA